MRFALLILLFTGIGLAGCKHTQPSEPLPATIEQTTATMKAEIQQAIVSLKGGIPPLISDTVFINSSTLLLEQGLSGGVSEEATLKAHPLPTQVFILQKRDIGCVLFYPKTARYILLKSVPCQAVIN